MMAKLPLVIKCLCQALPLCRYSEVMELAVGRLMDKSINAVKNAIQLLAAFIAHNPYSCKVTKTNISGSAVADICHEIS